MDNQSWTEANGGTGIPLGSLVSEVDARVVDRLREQYGEAFLVFAGRVEDLRAPPRPWQATVSGESRVAGGGASFSFKTTLVWPVRHTERTLSSRFMTVGRLVNTNDVVIADRSVSAFHAVFEPVQSGGYLIRDMGSRNGTFVNSRPVPKGTTANLKPGDVIRLGSINMMFLDAEKLSELVRLAHRS